MIKLNLLPPAEKEQLEIANVGCLVKRFFVYCFISFFIFTIFLLSTLLCLSVLLQSQSKLAEVRKDDPKTKYLLNLENSIEESNKIIEEVRLKQKELILWTPILEELSVIIPDQVYLTDFSYYASTDQASIKGRASTRQNVVDLQKLLEESQYCTEVSSPLANLLKQEDVSFSFTFKPGNNE